MTKVLSSVSRDTSYACDQKKFEKENKTSIVYLIHSAIENVQKRNILRKHAKHKQKQVIFVVGQAVEKLHQDLEHEIRSSADIISGDFIDSYTNLTLKQLFALKWIHKNCPQADFVIKADDDILINFDEVERVINLNYPKTTEPFVSRTSYKLFAGLVLNKLKVQRNSDNKWCATRTEFSKDEYPDFCSGWGYITTIETIEAILNQVEVSGRGFWIDDVFVTGMLRDAAKDIFLDPYNEKYSTDVVALKTWSEGNDTCRWDMMFSNTNGNDDLLKNAYKRLEQNQTTTEISCSRVREKSFVSRGRPEISLINISRT